MNSTLRSHLTHALAAGALSVALLSAGTAGAFAADPGAAASPMPTNTHRASPMPKGADSASPTRTRTGSPKPTRTRSASPKPTGALGSITVTASKTQVMAGDSVRFSGRTKGLKAGTALRLQHMHNGKWTTLKANTTVKKGSSYSLTAKFRTKGKEQVRVTNGRTVSPTVTVNVT